MFGVIRGTGFRLTCGEKRAWMGHVCGTCLALNHQSGQVARLTTNYDAALLSVLYEALSSRPLPRVTHHCPLRSGVRGQVVDWNTAGARYAASIALVSAATKVQDHLTDRDSGLRFLAWPFAWLAKRWLRVGHGIAHTLGFQTETIEAETRRQPGIEAQVGRDFFFYSQPTEDSVAAACSHVAILADCPEKMGWLHAIGRRFGRIMYLLDAFQDYEADARHGKFNPLAQCFSRQEIRQRAWELFRQAHGEIRHHFDRLSLPNPTLARRLLIDQLHQVGTATIGAGEETEITAAPPAENVDLPAGDPPPLPIPPTQKGQKNSGDCGGNWCTCDPCMFCSAGDCCPDGSNCDCSGLDCGGADCGGCDCSCG